MEIVLWDLQSAPSDSKYSVKDVEWSVVMVFNDCFRKYYDITLFYPGACPKNMAMPQHFLVSFKLFFFFFFFFFIQQLHSLQERSTPL